MGGDVITVSYGTTALNEVEEYVWRTRGTPSIHDSRIIQKK